MSVESKAPKHFLHQRLIRMTCAMAAILILAGCTTLPRTPYTSADAASARVLDLGGLRRYADEPALAFLKDSRARYRADGGPLTYLALSGGGADGAYGAGVLNGWTAAGTRPKFSVVSGVSTRALITPFAFLRPIHCATLRDIYTSGIAESLGERPDVISLL